MKKNVMFLMLIIILTPVSMTLINCEKNKSSSNLSSNNGGGNGGGGDISLSVAADPSLLLNKISLGKGVNIETINLTVYSLEKYTNMKNRDGTNITSNDQLVYKLYVKESSIVPELNEMIKKHTIINFKNGKLEYINETEIDGVNFEEQKTYHFMFSVQIKTDMSKITYSNIKSISLGSKATNPPGFNNNKILKTNSTETSISLQWRGALLPFDDTHLDNEENQLTKQNIIYKVYKLKENKIENNDVDAVIISDRNPIVLKAQQEGITITGLMPNTTYNIVLQSVNNTDVSKVTNSQLFEFNTDEPISLQFREENSDIFITEKRLVSQGNYGKEKITKIESIILPESINTDRGTFSISPDDLSKTFGLTFNKLDGSISGIATKMGNRRYTIGFTSEDNRTVSKTIDLIIGYKHIPLDSSELIADITQEIDIQGISADLNIIDTSNVKSFSNLFSSKLSKDVYDFKDKNTNKIYEFSGDISKWNTSNVTNMNSTFYGVTRFKSDLSNWDTSNVTDMTELFSQVNLQSGAFIHGVENWNTNNVLKANRILYSGLYFYDHDFSSWNMCRITLTDSDFHVRIKDVYADDLYIPKNKRPNFKGSPICGTIDNTTKIPPEVSNFSFKFISSGINMIWDYPTIDSEIHKNNDGDILSISEISYILYVKKLDDDEFGYDYDLDRIKNEGVAINIPANTKKHLLDDVYAETSYAIAITSVNETDKTKVSNGKTQHFETWKLVIDYDLNIARANFNVGDSVNKKLIIGATVLEKRIVNGNQQWTRSNNKRVSLNSSFTFDKADLDRLKHDTGLTASFSNNTVHITGIVNKSNFYDSKITNRKYGKIRFTIPNWNVTKDLTVNVNTKLVKVGGRSATFYRPTSNKELLRVIELLEKDKEVENLRLVDTSEVVDMSKLFVNKDYNPNVSNWNTSKVTNMKFMFMRSTKFNRDLSNWDTSKVNDMGGMFEEASSFNGNISNWDTSRVNDMDQMFKNATNFNQDISNWDTSKVYNMTSMFEDTEQFNQDISGWNISSIRFMKFMFKNSQKFDQDLSKWRINKTVFEKSYGKDVSWNTGIDKPLYGHIHIKFLENSFVSIPMEGKRNTYPTFQ